MSKYVIEIESLKEGLLILYAEQPGQHMRLAPGTRANPSVMAVTSEQFKAHAYDIEGHAEGKFGISTPDIQLWARDPDSDERERISFKEAAAFVVSDLLSDDAAKDMQSKADKKAAKQRAKKTEAGGAVVPSADGFAPVDALIES